MHALILWGFQGIAAESKPIAESLAQDGSPKSLKLEPFYRVIDIHGKEHLSTEPNSKEERSARLASAELFCAVRSERWPTGLVPLFQIKHGNQHGLSRLPISGEDNSCVPLFFALPNENEIEAVKLAGHWDFRATRDSTTSLTALEVTFANGEVSARFDQNTDYGFANFSRGTFKDDELQITVQYISDVYLLTGKCSSGLLKGQWKQRGTLDHGIWEASRSPQATVSYSGTVSLFEWTRASDGALRYASQQESLPAEWNKSAKPLCRVWKARDVLQN